MSFNLSLCKLQNHMKRYLLSMLAMMLIVSTTAQITITVDDLLDVGELVVRLVDDALHQLEDLGLLREVAIGRVRDAAARGPVDRPIGQGAACGSVD